MKRLLLILLGACLLLAACGTEDGDQYYESAALGVGFTYPAGWAAQEEENLLLIATDAATIRALQNNERINGGAIAISTEPLSGLGDSSPMDLMTVLLTNYGAFEEIDWQLDNAPIDITIADYAGVRATLRNATEGSIGSITIMVLHNDSQALFMVLTDTTAEQQYSGTLDAIALSLE